MPVKRTEQSPERVPYGPAPRFRFGGEYAFAAPRNANRRPDVRVWAAGIFTVVEFLNVRALFHEEAVLELADRLECLVADGHIQVVLDLSTVRDASSGVVAIVARLYRQVNEAGGSLRLYGPVAMLADAIRICRLDRVVEVCVDQAAALRVKDASSNV
jgi:anti-anti-sigma factor